ncbi:hypothetical protein LEMLEM_LOCUS16578 [Lemmus lemmus]
MSTRAKLRKAGKRELGAERKEAGRGPPFMKLPDQTC